MHRQIPVRRQVRVIASRLLVGRRKGAVVAPGTLAAGFDWNDLPGRQRDALLRLSRLLCVVQLGGPVQCALRGVENFKMFKIFKMTGFNMLR